MCVDQPGADETPMQMQHRDNHRTHALIVSLAGLRLRSAACARPRLRVGVHGGELAVELLTKAMGEPSSAGTKSASPSKQRPGWYETTVSGAVSGFAATVAKQPIQRLKWIRQVDAGKPVPYGTVLRQTVQSGGVLSLFQGSTAAICRNVPHSAIVYSLFPVFERCARAAHLSICPLRPATARFNPSRLRSRLRHRHVAEYIGTPGEPSNFAVRFWAGYATTFSATLVTHPLDTLRVRISVTQGEASLAQVARDVGAQGGFRALYHGFGATLIGAGPRGAVGFGVFETLKAWGRDSEAVQRHPSLAKFFFGYLAGFCAETAIYPLDTVRRRQQALGDATPLSRMPTVTAIIHLARHEGVAGMYKGLVLNLLKNPIATAVSFAVNDIVKERLRLDAAAKERHKG